MITDRKDPGLFFKLTISGPTARTPTEQDMHAIADAHA